MKALHAWPAVGWDGSGDKLAVYAELENKAGKKSLWSVGKLLAGHGDEREDVKAFGKVPGLDNIDIADLQVVDDEFCLLTTNGALFGWTQKGGKWADGSSKPKALEAINKLGKVVKFRKSKTHMIVQVQSEDG